MLFTRFCKQAWLICLMTFVIGWSGVSNAMSQPMLGSNTTTLQMQHADDQPNHTEQTVAVVDRVPKLSPHCMHMAALHDSTQTDAMPAAQHGAAMDTMQHGHCDSTVMDAMQQGHCDNCSMSLCQSSSAAWIYSTLSPLSVLPMLSMPVVASSDYSAQHLTGFWQQILRPPRA